MAYPQVITVSAVTDTDGLRGMAARPRRPAEPLVTRYARVLESHRVGGDDADAPLRPLLQRTTTCGGLIVPGSCLALTAWQFRTTGGVRLDSALLVRRAAGG
jgi:hypothetical protein